MTRTFAVMALIRAGLRDGLTPVRIAGILSRFAGRQVDAPAVERAVAEAGWDAPDATDAGRVGR